MVLVSDVIAEEHVIKELFDFMVGPTHGKSPPCQVWWLGATG